MAEKGTDTPSPDSSLSAKRGIRWLPILTGGLVTLISVLVAGIYFERMRVTAFLAQRYLADYGLQSQIEFSRLSWNGLHLRVRAGPADAPDFTAEGIDVTLVYPNTGLTGRVTPQVASVRLIRPFLRATYDGQNISFGSLQSLVDEMLATDTNGPKPAVTIQDGNLLLQTPNGILNFVADASIDKGQLNRLSATLQRTSLRGASFAAEIAGGTVSADFMGEALNGSVALKLDAIASGERNAHGVEASSDFRGLKWHSKSGSYAFTIASIAVIFNTAAMETPEVAATASASRIALESIAGNFDEGRLRASMPAEMTSEFTGLHSGGASVTALKVQSSFSSLAVDVSRAGWSASGVARFILDGKSVVYPQLNRALSLTSVKADFGGSGTVKMDGASGMLRGTISASGRLPRAIALRSLRVDFDGSGATGMAGSNATIRASLVANANVPRPAGLDLARQIPGIGGDQPISSSVAGALQAVSLRTGIITVVRSNEGLTFTSRAPVTLEGMGGASLSLRPRGGRSLASMHGEEIAGAFGLDISGGGLPTLHLAVPAYRYREGAKVTALDADTQFEASLDLRDLHGMRVSSAGKLQVSGDRIAFAAPGCTDFGLASFGNDGVDRVRNMKGRLCAFTLGIAGGRTQVDLPGCADVSFDSFLNNATAMVGDAKAKFCGAADRPIFIEEHGGWQLQGGWADASARIVAAESAIAGARGRLQLSGTGAEIKDGSVTVDQARLSDLLGQPRFLPLSARGEMRAAGADWKGEFHLASFTHPVANVMVRHSLNTGAGEASIEAGDLVFDLTGLQPGNLLPFLSSLGTRVRGRAAFTGRVVWSTAGFTSGGRLVLSGVDFQSRIGMVRQANADLAFSSLIPVALLPNQTLTANSVELFVPLEHVSAKFTYRPDALQLESVTADMAGGHVALDPVIYSFAPEATTAGTLRIQDIDVAPLISAAGLSGRVAVTARIGGTVPFTWGPQGVRFVNGHVASTGAGRLSIKREALTASVGVGGGAQAPPNAVQDFAYQALENLAFDRLEGTVNSQPMGRLGVLLHVTGKNDPAQVAETRVGVLDLLRGRAFDKPLPLPKGTPIDLTLDTSLNLDELLNAYFNRAGTDAAVR